jgi:hypothetical protein
MGRAATPTPPAAPPSSEPGTGAPLPVTFDAYGDQASAGTRSYACDALGRLTADAPSAGGIAVVVASPDPTWHSPAT